MNKNIIIAVVLVIILGISFFTWQKKEINKQAGTQPTPQAMAQINGNGMRPPGVIVDVEIKGFAYGPSDVTVNVGETVVWTNRDSVGHTVTALDGSFDSKIIPAGETFSHTFQKKGTFEYKCTPHPQMSKGKVTVM